VYIFIAIIGLLCEKSAKNVISSIIFLEKITAILEVSPLVESLFKV
jgi:hypothetical protein